MSQKRPWHTELSSLVVTLYEDRELAAHTVSAIAAHEAITVEAAVGKYLPLAIEAADARPIHQWLESLPGVLYVDVVFCSTEFSNSSTSPYPS
jgi:nitrate reductase NapAB chaperone NapD